jgi:Na+/phosphate symporter
MVAPADQHARRARMVAVWAVSAAIIGGYYLVGDDSDEGDARATAAPAALEDDDKLDVIDVQPGEPTPGSALAVRYVEGKQARSKTPVRALLSAPSGEATRTVDLDVLERHEGEVVVRVPKDARPARHKLRLQRGDERDTRSKPYDLRVKAINRQKVFRSVMGGLALLIFGLRTMSSGSRAYSGQRSQGLVAAVSRRRSAAVGLGVVVGLVAQFTTTAAGLMVSLMESHLLGATAATAVMLGAQLGAAAAPSVLGVASTTREGLLLVTIGVLWLTLAADRRGQALGKLILGCGLLFYGLHLLRIGFEPLVSDPEILPYIDLFHADSPRGLLVCVATGALLAALLQGPAPVFPLVLGLTQASGRIDLQSALAILAGTGLGASLGTTVVAWPFGEEPRRMARTYFVAALIGTILMAGSVDLWAYLANALVSGRPNELAYGKKVLLPHIGKHLLIGFVLSQLACTAVLTAALPLLVRITRRWSERHPFLPPPLEGSAGVKALGDGLARVLGFHRRALAAIMDLALTAHRARGRAGEHALTDARATLEALFGGAVRSGGDNPEIARLRQAALTTLQLQRTMEDLLRHGERSTERAMALSPIGEAWQPDPSDAQALRALHELLLQGLDAAEAQIARGAAPDLDAARSREIRLNALEGETRQALLTHADRGEEPRAIARRLVCTDLVNAYENVGNQLYRLHESLAAEVEQDAAE